MSVNTRKIIIVAMAVAAIVVLLITLASRKTVEGTADRTVTATVFPLCDIVRNVAGDDLTVACLLPPGTSPHTFEPTPSVIHQVNSASVVFVLGHGIDSWAETLAVGAERPIVAVDTDVPLRRALDEEEKEDGHGDEHSDGVDPHYWLSIPNAKLIAANVAADLTARYPELSANITVNLDRYQSALDRTDAQLRETLKLIGSHEIVTLHDAWYYFAEEYGLTIVGSFVPTPGREPTPQYLAALGQAVSRSGSRTLFSEPQISTGTLEPFIHDHRLKIAILDPLGGTGDRTSYIKTMLANAETIAENQ